MDIGDTVEGENLHRENQQNENNSYPEEFLSAPSMPTNRIKNH